MYAHNMTRRSHAPLTGLCGERQLMLPGQTRCSKRTSAADPSAAARISCGLCLDFVSVVSRLCLGFVSVLSRLSLSSLGFVLDSRT